MKFRLGLLSLSMMAWPALASAAPAPDLAVSFAPAPASVYVYTVGRYDVTVSNVGNQTASGVSLSIQLPVTHTSPTVHLMGALGAMSAACSSAGTTIACSLGTLRKGRSTTVFFEMMLPQNSVPLAIVATASTTSAEPPALLSNNVATHTAVQLHPSVPVVAPRGAHIRHCTGQNLTSFFECTLYPSSLSWHDIMMNADGSVTFVASSSGPIPPDVTGTWSQSNTQQLSLRYSDSSGPAAIFDGFGVSAGSCFEGVTTFPGSPYVSPYEVCLQ